MPMKETRFEALTVVFQPVVRLEDGVLRGFEALARWPSKDALSFSRPEAPDVLSALSRQVLEQAVAIFAGWRASCAGAQSLVLNVNLPGLDLYSEGLVGRVAEIVKKYAIAPFALRLEVTEHDVLPDLVRAHEVIGALARAGIGVAIDDFGAGATSLMWLLELPVQCVKLDRELVQGVHRGERGIHIVRHILALLNALELETVAEGLELAETGEHLRRLGCKSGQGYLFAPPLGETDARALIARSGAGPWPFRPDPARPVSGLDEK